MMNLVSRLVINKVVSDIGEIGEHELDHLQSPSRVKAAQ
jgi:hypothetical protein